MPNKSKNLKEVLIQANYFVDFLRGYFDGDGYTYSYYDRRWKSSFMLYTGFVSASEKYLEWIKTRIKELCGIEGRIKSSNRAFQLVYAKYASIKLLERLYKGQGEIYLKRKKFKIDNALDIIKNMPRC